MFKNGWNVFDFSYIYFKIIFDNKFWKILGGTAILAPLSVVSPNMRTPAPPMTPLFYCRILFFSENGDGCKKLELNVLRFDQDMRFWIWKKYFQNYYQDMTKIQTHGSEKVKINQSNSWSVDTIFDVLDWCIICWPNWFKWHRGCEGQLQLPVYPWHPVIPEEADRLHPDIQGAGVLWPGVVEVLAVVMIAPLIHLHPLGSWDVEPGDWESS